MKQYYDLFEIEHIEIALRISSYVNQVFTYMFLLEDVCFSISFGL